MLKCTVLGLCLFAIAGMSSADEVKKAEIGKPAPDFTATGIDGKEFKLSDKLKSGKNVVLIFSRANW